MLTPLPLIALLWVLPAGASEQWPLDAMTVELERARTGLAMDGYDAPYFISFLLREHEADFLGAKAGALFQDGSSRGGYAVVDVRVGSAELDSSEDTDAEFSVEARYLPNALTPIEPSPDALSRVLWLLADYRYKAALVSFQKVKSKGVNDPKVRAAGSLTHETPIRLVEETPSRRFDRAMWQAGLRRISSAFLAFPRIFDASVEMAATRQRNTIVTTEGSTAATHDDYVQVLVSAAARANDGMLLEDTLAFYGRSITDIPDPKHIEAEVRRMAERLTRLREAPVLEPATVPVLMSPEATGIFFHETIGHRLEGGRQDRDDEGRTFRGRVGQRILPEFIDILDDPTMERAAGQALNGHYRVDAEGVLAQRVLLVERGVLRTFLMSRRPVEGVDRSNGHGRSDGLVAPTARMGNLLVRSAKVVPYEQLKRMLLDEVRRQGKPYGLIIETIAGGSTNTSTVGYQAFKGVPRVAYRVDARTGHEELVRGFEIVGTPLTALNTIVAASDRQGVFNGYCGAESGSIPVSTVAPDMLFSALELQRSDVVKERLPILPPPAVVRARAQEVP